MALRKDAQLARHALTRAAASVQSVTTGSA
jgi:hypothetical protein